MPDGAIVKHFRVCVYKPLNYKEIASKYDGAANWYGPHHLSIYRSGDLYSRKACGWWDFYRGVLSITDFCKNSQKPETKTKGIRATTSKRMAIDFAFAFWGEFFNKHLYSRGQKNLNDFEIIFKAFYI